MPDHIEDDNTTNVQEEKQEKEQRGEQEINQTPDLNLRPNTGSKHLEVSMWTSVCQIFQCYQPYQ